MLHKRRSLLEDMGIFFPLLFTYKEQGNISPLIVITIKMQHREKAVLLLMLIAFAHAKIPLKYSKGLYVA